MWIVTIYAFRSGSKTERIAATCIMAGSYLSALVVSSSDVMFTHVEVQMALVDSGLFVILWCLGLWSNRFWPIWLAATQGVTVLAHAAPLIPNMSPYAVHRAVALWSWPQWVILAYAVYQHRREQRGHRVWL